MSDLYESNLPVANLKALLELGAELCKRYPLPPLSPRGVTAESYLIWYDQLVRHSHRLAIDIDEDMPLEIPHFVGSQAATRTTAEERATLKAAHAAAMAQYQLENNVLYDIVRPSLVLTGTFHETDLEFLRTHFEKGPLRQGRKLVEWARQWQDKTSIDGQIEARNELDAIKLPHSTTSETVLVETLNKLWRAWRKIKEHDPTKPADFYARLMRLLPSIKHDGSPLQNIRVWLGNLVDQAAHDTQSESALLLEDVPALITRMSKYAKLIGMKSEEQHGDQQGLHLLNKQPREPRDADCTWCDHWDCDGNPCMSKKDSKVDLSKLSRIQKTRALAGRAFHKQHPNIKNLKGVKLSLRLKKKDGDKEDDKGKKDSKKDGQLTAIAPPNAVLEIEALLDKEISDKEGFRAWLMEIGVADVAGLHATGDLSDLEMVVEADESETDVGAANDTPAPSMTLAEARELQLQMARTRDEMIRVKEENERLTMHSRSATAPPSAALALAPSPSVGVGAADASLEPPPTPATGPKAILAKAQQSIFGAPPSASPRNAPAQTREEMSAADKGLYLAEKNVKFAREHAKLAASHAALQSRTWLLNPLSNCASIMGARYADAFESHPKSTVMCSMLIVTNVVSLLRYHPSVRDGTLRNKVKRVLAVTAAKLGDLAGRGSVFALSGLSLFIAKLVQALVARLAAAIERVTLPRTILGGGGSTPNGSVPESGGQLTGGAAMSPASDGPQPLPQQGGQQVTLSMSAAPCCARVHGAADKSIDSMLCQPIGGYVNVINSTHRSTPRRGDHWELLQVKGEQAHRIRNLLLMMQEAAEEDGWRNEQYIEHAKELSGLVAKPLDLNLTENPVLNVNLVALFVVCAHDRYPSLGNCIEQVGADVVTVAEWVIACQTTLASLGDMAVTTAPVMLPADAAQLEALLAAVPTDASVNDTATADALLHTEPSVHVLSDALQPNTGRQYLQSPQRALWQAALDREMDAAPRPTITASFGITTIDAMLATGDELPQSTTLVGLAQAYTHTHHEPLQVREPHRAPSDATEAMSLRTSIMLARACAEVHCYSTAIFAAQADRLATLLGLDPLHESMYAALYVVLIHDHYNSVAHAIAGTGADPEAVAIWSERLITSIERLEHLEGAEITDDTIIFDQASPSPSVMPIDATAALEAIRGLFPLGTVKKDWVPALMDDGASDLASCCKTLKGAILSSLDKSHAGTLGVGNDEGGLKCNGSYLYLHERQYANGVSTYTLRRLRHAPNLVMPCIFSEADENKYHQVGIYWPPGKARSHQIPGGALADLFMSSSNLGFTKCRPIDSKQEQQHIMRLLAGQSTVLIHKETPKVMAVAEQPQPAPPAPRAHASESTSEVEPDAQSALRAAQSASDVAEMEWLLELSTDMPPPLLNLNRDCCNAFQGSVDPTTQAPLMFEVVLALAMQSAKLPFDEVTLSHACSRGVRSSETGDLIVPPGVSRKDLVARLHSSAVQQQSTAAAINAIGEASTTSQLAKSKARAAAGDASNLRSTSMGTMPTLMGVTFLRRMHTTHGHIGVPRLVETLIAEGFGNRFTSDDIAQFKREGCGVCESMKIIRRPTAGKSLTDTTTPPLGKKWVGDAHELDVPSAEFGFRWVYRYVEVNSKLRVTFGTLDYTAESVTLMDAKLQAFVRPVHGDIWIVRWDSHPSHKAKLTAKAMIERQRLLQFSPPYCHWGASPAEVSFYHDIPAANALLMQAPDLDEKHMFVAIKFAGDAANAALSDDRQPPTSANMRYYQLAEMPPSNLAAFGAAVKVFTHAEAREGKHYPHEKAYPAVYVGAALFSTAHNHSAVWDGDKRYIDVDSTMLNMNEDVVLARTVRSHPCHQPFNQESATKDVTADTTKWYNVANDLSTKPAVILGDLIDDAVLDTAPPHHHTLPWVANAPNPTHLYTVGIAAGESRPGDVASWTWFITKGAVQHVPIDLKVGGQEHNYRRPETRAGLLQLVDDTNCLGALFSDECAPWSALRFNRPVDNPGPPVLFDLDFPDGKLDDQGSVLREAASALQEAELIVELGQPILDRGGWILVEAPASQAVGAVYASRDPTLAKHSTLYDTSIMKAFIAQNDLSIVYTEQGASGAATRKPTALLCPRSIVQYVQQELGTLVQLEQQNAPSLVGSTPEAIARRAASARYTSLFSRRLVTATDRLRVETIPALPADPNAPPATVDLHPAGSRVEVYWPPMRTWFSAAVLRTRVTKASVAGVSMPRREIKVKYDVDGVEAWHALNNNTVRRETTTAIEKAEFLALIDTRVSIVASLGYLPPLTTSEGQDVTRQLKSPSAWEGEVLVHRQVLLDIETQAALDPCQIMVISGGEAISIAPTIKASINLDPQAPHNTEFAHLWHTPANWREYLRSPQRSLWRTAMELKMDEYNQLHTFDLVPESEVDTLLYKIYETLWVFKIKTDSERVFEKLNPRWCFVGTSMDRKLYHSYTEMMRQPSFSSMAAIKGAYYVWLLAFAADCGNAFQATRTDYEGSKVPPTYCRQPLGFQKKGPNGEKMVCKLLVGMQGRIDATLLFDQAFVKILKDLGFVPLLWEPKLFEYHNTALAGSDASLTDIIRASSDASLEPENTQGSKPYGWALVGQHVDDSLGLATGTTAEQRRTVKANRIVKYLEGGIAVHYALKLTGWKKHLGFKLELDDKLQTVTVSAPNVLADLTDLLCKGTSMLQPKQPTRATFDDIEAGVPPPHGHPERDDYLVMQSLCRQSLGVFQWYSFCDVRIKPAINKLAKHTQHPHHDTLAGLRHVVMFCNAHPYTNCFGGVWCQELEQPAQLIHPFTKGAKAAYFHWFSDSSLTMTGGVGMLAGGPIAAISSRPHLANPDSTTGEIVAAGTNVHHLYPINGMLQELHIRLGKPTPFYLDSGSTVFVAMKDSAVKKSVWLMRRAVVLQEGVALDEIMPFHIPERDMVADSFTKYIRHEPWARHMHYLMNWPGDPPDAHEQPMASQVNASKEISRIDEDGDWQEKKKKGKTEHKESSDNHSGRGGNRGFGRGSGVLGKNVARGKGRGRGK